MYDLSGRLVRQLFAHSHGLTRVDDDTFVPRPPGTHASATMSHMDAMTHGSRGNVPPSFSKGSISFGAERCSGMLGVGCLPAKLRGG